MLLAIRTKILMKKDSKFKLHLSWLLSKLGRSHDISVNYVFLCNHNPLQPPETITRQAITWNPQGRGEEVGHETAGRDTEKETKQYTRREMEKMATDRKWWRSLIDGLYSQRAKR